MPQEGINNFLNLAVYCLEEVNKWQCASEWLVYKCIVQERGLHGKVARTDVQSILNILAYLRLVKRVKILGATYYCAPDVPKNFVPPELREILNIIRSIVLNVKSSAVGITTRAVVRRLRERLRIEPSSQVVTNTLKELLKEAGLDVTSDGKPTNVSKKDRRRGTIYIYHKGALLETVNKYLNGHVEHEEKSVKMIRSDMRNVAKQIQQLMKPQK